MGKKPTNTTGHKGANTDKEGALLSKAGEVYLRFKECPLPPSWLVSTPLAMQPNSNKVKYKGSMIQNKSNTKRASINHSPSFHLQVYLLQQITPIFKI